MVDWKIEKYIGERYQRWRDYAQFHCRLAKIPDEAGDVLNEVLMSLLQKNEKMIIKLFNRKKRGYRELDYFVLKMIKLNAHSPTSPYRHKTKDVLKDENIEPWNLEIEEVQVEETDPNQEKLENFRKIRCILEGLNITDFERKVFVWKFFGDNSLNSWPGNESYPNVSKAFHKVSRLMKRRIKNPHETKRRWTKNEIDYLKAEYPSTDTVKIAGYLNRNYDSVRLKASRLKLKKICLCHKTGNILTRY